MPSASDDPPGADRPPHLKLVKGRWYWDPPDRLRRSHGLKTVSLGADQPNAWAAARKLNREHLKLGDDAPAVGTVAWVFATFNASEKFEALAAKTQRDYRHLAKVLGGLELGTSTFGRTQAMAVKPRHADALFAKVRKERGLHTAHYACRYARRVWKWAARREMVGPVNPWSGMELPSLPARDAIWTAEQVAAVVAAAEEAKRPSLGLATLLAYWLGHREQDVLSLIWTALEGSHRETAKTGARLPVVIAAYPELATVMAATKRVSTHVVVREGETPGPYNEHTFRHEWREVATAAGIPKTLQFRDLRATAMTEISDGGADIIHLSTHGGHKTLAMPKRYVRPTAKQFETAAKARLSGRKAREE